MTSSRSSSNSPGARKALGSMARKKCPRLSGSCGRWVRLRIGENEAPNPAEQLMHALAACLTTSLVYVAAARGVKLTRVESRLEGDMDVRGALGLSDAVRNGYEQIRVTFDVEGDASAEKLRELVERAKARSAVYDIVTNGVPVHVGAIT